MGTIVENKKIISIFAMIILLLSNFTFANNESNVETFINDIGNETLDILKNKNISDEYKEKELRRIFIQAIDVDWIGRFAIGRYWKRADQNQKEEYISLYRNFLINMYVSKFKQFTDENFKINAVKKLDEDKFVVHTEIVKLNEPNIVVDYSVKWNDKNNKFKIYDIVAEGVSLIAAQRSEISNIAARNGIDGLLEKLKKYN